MMVPVSAQKRIVIVGGGFGGVRAALDLSAQHLDAKITLIDGKSYLEYYAALYRVVAGKSPTEVCVPFSLIFKGSKVEVVKDMVDGVDLHHRIVRGTSGSHYGYDYLVIAIGSETAYFGIPGMQELSYGMKSAQEAVKLKNHLHEVFEAARTNPDAAERTQAAHIVVIGAGPSGVELAGELASYVRALSKHHGLSPSLVTIDLVEAMSRVLPTLEPEMSQRVLERLRHVGVNVLLGRSVTKQDAEQVYLKDMQMKTKTVVWTAGVKANAMLAKIDGLQLDRRGRAEVDEFRQAKFNDNVFVIGDAAATQYSGTAQTAVRDGAFVADAIGRKMRGEPLTKATEKPSAFAIPVGEGWAAVAYGPLRVYGRFGWWMRRAADLKVFLSMLKPWHAVRTWMSGGIGVETCPLCKANSCDC